MSRHYTTVYLSQHHLRKKLTQGGIVQRVVKWTNRWGQLSSRYLGDKEKRSGNKKDTFLRRLDDTILIGCDDSKHGAGRDVTQWILRDAIFWVTSYPDAGLGEQSQFWTRVLRPVRKCSPAARCCLPVSWSQFWWANPDVSSLHCDSAKQRWNDHIAPSSWLV